MAFLKQIIKRKSATNKNKQNKIKAVSTKYSYTNKTSNNTTRKYAYTKKVYINGKVRYYYA